MSITQEYFGKTRDGQEVSLYTLSNSTGMVSSITNYGGRIVTLLAPDRKGNFDDLVLGFDSLEEYLGANPYFGSLIGRCANRIENARVRIQGVEYQLCRNDGDHHSHGGSKGFDKVVWAANILEQDGQELLELSYLSKDGEEGYPGNLSVTVCYSLTEEDALKIRYLAETDKATIVSLTNHSYFNLSGHESGDVLDHQIMIDADSFTEICAGRYTTGRYLAVEGTPMDLRKRRPIRTRMFEENQQLTWAIGGYDLNWVLNASGDYPEKFSEVYDRASGRLMEVETTMPGVQFYVGNKLKTGLIGKNGARYEPYSGLCLETQHFPNAANHPHFPSPVLQPGEIYDHTTIYRFKTE
ncbi:MAG: galactose mutarotase [Spirochaetaceae bacterium]|nr:MAG: galactose mutarotase [Spirochaetaceae bacterium]